ncbi:MAG: methyltransferase domain-containing protein [Rikenellaceae bacterium]|nr:methyltransferase domain-containing protein [Rikenellaceae bacterium]
MLTRDEYNLLASEELRTAIRTNRHRDPLQVALDRSLSEPRLVATQLKYLTRAATKLPSYAEACCILPPRAFEQASSERCAAHKPLNGERVLDLTCGLGVDALALSHRFRQVVTLERNEVLADVARENFRRLGANNITVVTTDAESYVAACEEHFDWIFADPDRRSAEGKKLVCLEDCSPDVLALMPHLKRLAPRLCLKNSPLFDVDEAFRLFPEADVEVVSLGGECKEVLISVGEGIARKLTATSLDSAESFSLQERPSELPHEDFDPTRYRFLILPDVALQKARLTRAYFACEEHRAAIWSEHGYAFTTEPPQKVMGRVEEIVTIEPYDPKQLKRRLKGQGVELLKRDFDIPLETVRRRLGLREGNKIRLALTKIESNYWTISLK